MAQLPPFGWPLPPRLDRFMQRVAPPWADDWTGAVSGRGVPLMQKLVPLLLLAVLVQSVAHVVNVAVYDLSIQRLNADFDPSLVSWLGTVTTGAAAYAALLLSLLRSRLRRPLLVLGVLLTYLSLDDAVALHELVGAAGSRLPLWDHAGYNVWPLVYLPVLAAISWLLARTARMLDPRARNAVFAGLVCLVLAVVLESSAPVLFAAGSGHGQPLYEAEVLVEEALETFGWGSIALGLWAGVVDLLSASPGNGEPTSGRHRAQPGAAEVRRRTNAQPRSR